MNFITANVALALLCDPVGSIREVVRDNLNLSTQLLHGFNLAQLVDKVSQQKAEEFISVLKEQETASGWQMYVPLHDHRKILFFSGERAQGGFLILGTSTRPLPGKEEGYSDSQLAQTEEAVTSAHILTRRYDHFYEQLTRLNAELMGLREQMERQGAELLAAQKKLRAIEQRTRNSGAISV